MRITGLLLAAGRSRRMGRPKLSLELAPERSVGGLALEAMLGCRELAAVVAVVRPDDGLGWVPISARTGAGDRLRFAPCPDAARGMSHSLRCGLAAARRDGADAVLIALGDQPFVAAERLDGLVAEWRRDRKLDYAASVHGDALLPPALLGRAMFAAIETLEGDEGARKLLASGEWRGVRVAMASPLEALDVDTPAHYAEAIKQYKVRFM